MVYLSLELECEMNEINKKRSGLAIFYKKMFMTSAEGGQTDYYLQHYLQRPES